MTMIFDPFNYSTLYIGGYFTKAGGEVVNYLTRWNGTGYTAFRNGPNVGMGHAVLIFAFNVTSGTLYVGKKIKSITSFNSNFFFFLHK